MPQSNIDLVKSLYAAFGRGEIEKIIEAATPDVSWRLNGRRSDDPLFGERHGLAGVREFFQILSENEEAIEFTPREFYTVQDKVFVLGHYKWRIRATGKTPESDFIHIFTLAGDKYRSFLEFTDTAQFAEAQRK
ncbi:MAG: nuclear transport factor 2 family protein [Methylobacteriaceae bacterium]|nr:nuclear transport factor 2 family protein [Methylobacteriaceae bacterium]